MLTSQTLTKDAEDKMKRALANVSREFGEVRGGRATPALVEHVTVEYYGTATPLRQLAAITAPEPHLLIIQPWDAKAVADIDKAIQKASLGLAPIVEGKILRLPIPPLTGERRDELTKVIHRMAEEGRVSIRTVRRDANEAVKKLKNEKKLTEDDVFKSQEAIQKLTDKYTEQIDALVKAKEQELHST
ncbi:MAG: ribosome recycling factor [Candidatus Omnitrophica bacterium]|nr:ribosome recycling factor [Candidatus Omnitrophota bacterium]MBI2175050.1 ribosome recycling factor [Candidatus Omnitrophota bacterium]